jgi:hypothetical protein
VKPDEKDDFFFTEKISYDSNIAPHNFYIGWYGFNKILNCFGENGLTSYDLVNKK